MVCINLFLSVIRKGTDWKPFQTRFGFNHLLFWAIYLKVLWWLKCQETWVQISGLPLHKVKLFTFSKFQLVHQWNGLVTSIYKSAVLHEEHENWPQSAWNAADIQYRIWILLCMSHPQILVLCSFVSLMKKNPENLQEVGCSDLQTTWNLWSNSAKGKRQPMRLVISIHFHVLYNSLPVETTFVSIILFFIYYNKYLRPFICQVLKKTSEDTHVGPTQDLLVVEAHVAFCSHNCAHVRTSFVTYGVEVQWEGHNCVGHRNPLIHCNKK